jgi:hypothetical protein
VDPFLPKVIFLLRLIYLCDKKRHLAKQLAGAATEKGIDQSKNSVVGSKEFDPKLAKIHGLCYACK